jgi:hypothetical protein
MTDSASEWAIQQWATAELGDVRRTARAVAIGARMAAAPEATLPTQMRSSSELKGAYRLLNNPDITLAQLLAPHCATTRAAAGRTQLTLLVQDTTELDYTAHANIISGLGPIGNGGGQGLLLHSTLAVVPATGQVLGLADARVVLRQPLDKPRNKARRSPEACLWEDAAEQVGQPPTAATWMHVCDRGADDFDLMAVCRRQGAHFLIRARHNRRLQWPMIPPASPLPGRLLDYARSLPPHPGSQYQVAVPATFKHPARQADVVLSWGRVTFPPPSNATPPIADEDAFTVWVVRAWEVQPPPEIEPLEWILLTSWPIQDLAEARFIIQCYTRRWLVEDFHQCLKTGCQVEDSQLDDRADLERLLGFALPIAARLLQLRQDARNTPEVPATAIVEPLMVKVLLRLRPRLKPNISVAAFWAQVARLGGHPGRRGDGPPGWRTIWRGWRYLSDLADGARLFVSDGGD